MSKFTRTPFLAAVVVSSSFAAAGVLDSWRPAPAPVAGEAAQLQAEADALAADARGARARARGTCDTCGVVESIRRIDDGGDTPSAFEFTVRLRDGSVRTSIIDSASNWRAGDGIMLIGGPEAPAAKQH